MWLKTHVNTITVFVLYSLALGILLLGVLAAARSWPVAQALTAPPESTAAPRPDPSVITVLKPLDLPAVTKMVVSGKLTYLATVEGLRIVDLSDPTQPRFLGSYLEPSPLEWGILSDLQVQGDRAYLAWAVGGVDVLDIADPAAPRLLGRYSGERSAFFFGANALQVVDNLIYAVGTTDRPGDNAYDFTQVLLVLDSTEVQQIKLQGTTLCACATIQLVGQRAYVSDPGTYNTRSTHPTFTPGGFAIYDLSAPLTPKLQATVTITDAFTQQVVIDGAYAYAATVATPASTTRGGLRIFDLREQQPTLIAAPPTNDAFALSVDAGTAYVSTGEGLAVVDVQTPTQPRVQKTIVGIQATYVSVQGTQVLWTNVSNEDGVQFKLGLLAPEKVPAAPTH